MAGTGRSGVGLRSERGPVLLAIMLSTGLVAIDSTIIATAGPSIVASLGGFAQFPWLFSVYLLAQAVSVPIYGKLADQVGRRPIMLLGIGLFLIGSVLCGAAWNMGVLIVFRAVQGLGAGAVQPMSMTIIGDLYTVRERARVTGYISSVWGISAVVGPTLGGLFSDFLSWRWIFFVNIPLCLAAAVMLQRNFHEKVTRRKHHIDYTGTILLTAGSTLVILGLLEGGQGWRWDSIAGIGVPVAGLLLLVGFVQVERRADEPVLPLWVFTCRVLVTSSLVSLAVGGRADRADHLRPHLRPDQPWHLGAGRRLRAGHPGDRLADHLLAGRAVVLTDRISGHVADRVRADGGGRGRNAHP